MIHCFIQTWWADTPNQQPSNPINPTIPTYPSNQQVSKDFSVKQ